MTYEQVRSGKYKLKSAFAQAAILLLQRGGNLELLLLSLVLG